MEEFHEQHPAWLQNFINTYEKLSINNLESLLNLYQDDVEFRDPLQKISGISELNQYFNGLYQNLTFCQFSIYDVIFDQNKAAVYWTMVYRHPKLNGGEEIHVEGSSLLKGEGNKVHFHRDYLDLGAMLYEHVPFVGSLVRWLKRKAVK